MKESDLVWNRAAFGGGAAPRRGDRELAAVLVVHNEAMSSGMLHAVETLELAVLEAAEQGLRWLGLDRAAEAIAFVRGEISAGAPISLKQEEALEREADARYAREVPTDTTLVTAFEERFRQDPQMFAPLSPETIAAAQRAAGENL